MSIHRKRKHPAQIVKRTKSVQGSTAQPKQHVAASTLHARAWVYGVGFIY